MKIFIAFVSIALCTVFFQNCGQPGSLVLDGVAEMSSNKPTGIDNPPLVDDLIGDDLVKQEQEQDQDQEDSPSDETPPAVYGSGSINHDDEEPSVITDAVTLNEEDSTDEDDITPDNNLEAFACDKDKQGKVKKVFICHIPPGNISEQHTLCVGVSSLKGHVHKDSSHKDYLGPCHEQGSGGL